jgi:hypothetical protein
LWEGNNEPGTRWLDPGRVLVGLNGGFEVIGMDGRVIASHEGTGSRVSTGAGVASVVASPDGKRLAYLAWTTDIDLEVYLLDLETGYSRAAGPASSFTQIVGKGTRIEASELYWSGDGSWLAWDWKTEGYLQQSVYAHEVATGQTRLVATDAMFFGFGDYPWLPDGNLLEYRMSAADTGGFGGAFYALEADDLDSGRPLFVAPYPMPPLTVTDSQSGQSLTIVPDYFCNRTWLGNGEVFWNGCDGNTYLSRIAGQTLDDTLLVARGTSWLTLSKNREIFLLSPVYPDTSWQMYDYTANRLLKQSEPVSGSFYTWLI